MKQEYITIISKRIKKKIRTADIGTAFNLGSYFINFS